MSRAAEIAKELFGAVKDTVNALAPGLKNAGPEIAAEIKREITQTRGELAHALFSGSGYLPYGAGQQPTHGLENGQGQEHGQEQERGGMGR